VINDPRLPFQIFIPRLLIYSMKQIFLYIACLTGAGLLAQSKGDTTLLLDSFRVEGRRNTFGIQTTRLDLNVTASQSLASTLQLNSDIYVKQISPGGLATIGMRGLSAQHTAILWN
jgi:iron complex outermembrane receptor protein